MCVGFPQIFHDRPVDSERSVQYKTRHNLILVPALAIFHAGLIALTRYRDETRVSLLFDSRVSPVPPFEKFKPADGPRPDSKALGPRL